MIFSFTILFFSFHFGFSILQLFSFTIFDFQLFNFLFPISILYSRFYNVWSFYFYNFIFELFSFYKFWILQIYFFNVSLFSTGNRNLRYTCVDLWWYKALMIASFTLSYCMNINLIPLTRLSIYYLVWGGNFLRGLENL